MGFSEIFFGIKFWDFAVLMKEFSDFSMVAEFIFQFNKIQENHSTIEHPSILIHHTSNDILLKTKFRVYIP
jgi:hypothetical protein